MKLNVLFRCDASSEIGFGHLMRNVALAEWLQANGDDAQFLIRDNAAARRVLQDAPMSVTWLRASATPAGMDEAIRESVRAITVSDEPPWVVVDHYEQPQRQGEAARKAGARVMMIDDLGGSSGDAQALTNPNLDAEPSWYPDANGTQLLLGAAYVMLRREVLAVRRRRSCTSPVRRILVTLGGSDRRNGTALVLKGLNALPASQRRRLSVDVVLGHGFCHQAAIAALAGDVDYACTVHCEVSKISDYFARAEMAITAAGGTLFETAFLGIPSLTLTLSANQAKNAAAFARRGLAISLGSLGRLTPAAIAHDVMRLLDDPPRRAAMSARGRRLIDGRGVERIRRAMATGARPRPRRKMVVA